MEIVWDGITNSDVLNFEHVEFRHALADAAKKYEWSSVLNMLRDRPDLVNTVRPGGRSFYAPLHQAAHAGASREVVEGLIHLGAWRTLQNARGERPLDVAERFGHEHLLDTLQPLLRRQVPIGVLLKIQAHFHQIVLSRAAEQVRSAGLRLPELEPLLELELPKAWLPVPGMYGGFSYRLQSHGVEALLVSESWSRVVGGSGQRHEITSSGAHLVDEGFV